MTPMKSSGLKSVPRTENFKPWAESCLYSSAPPTLSPRVVRPRRGIEFLVSRFTVLWKDRRVISGAPLLRMHTFKDGCVYFVRRTNSSTGI